MINLVEDDKLNEVGRLDNAFSSSWLKTQSTKKYEEIAKKTRITLQNTFGAKKDTAMWSCTKAYQDLLSPAGFKGAYVVCNARATNEFRKREHLAYLRNIYMSPRLWLFYRAMRAVEPSHDDYALAELLQWVFRSAIRNDKAIDLYLPSSRMRKLLKGWMSYGGLLVIAEGIPVLPVRDSFVVATKWNFWLKERIEQAYRELMGFDALIDGEQKRLFTDN